MGDEKVIKKKSGTGRGDSAEPRKAAVRRGAVILSAALTVLIMTFGAGFLRADADERAKTVVIKAASEDEFAAESSKLAKKNSGLTIQGTGRAKPYSSARLIVCVKEGEKVDFSKYDATTVVESDFGVSLVQFDSANASKKAAAKIGALSGVSYVEPDDCFVNIGETIAEEVGKGNDDESEDLPSQVSDEIGDPGDLKIGDRTYGGDEDLIYENSLQTESVTISSDAMSWGASYIQADKHAAFVRANTSRTIKVAVVDTGVSSHTRLSGRILAGRDFVDNDNDPSDRNGHGTHVAGIIADCTPGINVKILPVRVMNSSGEGSPSIVGNGIRYAANSGAKVINLSLGAYQHYQYIEQCITYAHNKGVTVVVAAGNECDNTTFVCPAHMSSPIVVGAIDSNGKRAYFSNYGSSLDVVAPGVDIRSCWLNGKYATASGTSMAVPHVSAAAAMYRLMNPSITAARTEYLVRCYTKDLGTKGTDKYYGRGVPRMAGAITPSKVTLSKTKVSLRADNTMTLNAAITPSYAGRNKLTWSSSNENIVTVSGGKLTAKHEGVATITVKTVNGKKATCEVTVSNATGELLQIGTLLKGPVFNSIAQSLSIALDKDVAEFSKKNSPPAASSQKNSSPSSPQTVTASAPAQSVSGSSSGVTEPAETEGSAAAAQTREAVRIYIYPSEVPGNAPVQDRSIVAGSRLALDAEIVPAQGEDAVLTWESSDPTVASVDEKGVVTAVSAGDVQITAVIAAAEESNTGASAAEPAQASEGAAGTYAVTVVSPSVLTRHASYSAQAENEVIIDAVLRLPASLSDDSAEDADRINPCADYVVAILREENGDRILLGAVDLGGDDSGMIHVHHPGNGGKRTDITQVRGASDEILTDMASGKQACETGILCMRSMNEDGSKADLSLAADVEALRALAGAGDARTETLSDCRVAVYTAAAFEEREKAAEKKDKDAIRRIDEKAVCTCSFSLSYDIPAQDVQDAEQTGETDEADTGSEAQSQDESEKGGSADPDETGEDAEDKDTGSDDSAADRNAAESDNPGQDGDTPDTSPETGGRETSEAAQEEEPGEAEETEDTSSEESPAEDGESADTAENASEGVRMQDTGLPEAASE